MITSDLDRSCDDLRREVDELVRPLIDTLVEEMAPESASFRALAADRFHHVVEVERPRWIRAFHTLVRRLPAGALVADLGCYVPYMPLMLSRYGFRVRMVDKYSIYGERFREAVQELAAREGIELWDLDIQQDDLSPLGRGYDAVLMMALVEHLLGSPKRLMAQVRQLLEPNGILYFEVPNIASGLNRIRLLAGRSPLPSYPIYYHSPHPFTGHNREMTVDEVSFLFKESGFALDSIDCWDVPTQLPRRKLRRLAHKLFPARHKGNAILAIGSPATES